ncbi:hypothetical protein B841_05885 [Corynebacterium maris DSM 45190]|uniref:Esterase n=1 Tax=Corynebacterium maris DSM 45190 TaxID=1224163 RepID=S5T230_9CORY|nr:alpha/beta hydrolase family protein [Corynebacterium maris]AGS34650.1 hypothetical protein B841_05885 [Corynebacterium maris DSM 45190]
MDIGTWTKTPATLVAAAAIALTTAFPPGAGANPVQQSADAVSPEVIAESSQSSWPTGGSTDAALSSVEVLGSTNMPVGPLSSGPIGQRPAIDPDATPAVVDVNADPNHAGVQRWTIDSPAMGRHVDVQVAPAAGPGPAPMLYLLDGVDAPADSGWLHQSRVHDNPAFNDVTLVMPTGAGASMYVDWYANDPVLGQNQWETFLTRELPPLLENHDAFHHNGKRGIAGLSMGASGAVALANANPGFYDAVAGISGCYSTTSPAGRLMAHHIVNGAGGALVNLYGPSGAANWDRYNVAADPSGLAGTAVYLSASQGAFTEEELEYFAERQFAGMVNGMALEWGAESCTRELDDAMREAGMTHQQVEIRPDGVHNWPNFTAALNRAWNTIGPALHP